MKTVGVVGCLLVFALLTVVAFTAHSAAKPQPRAAQDAENPDEVMHIFQCKVNEGFTPEQVEATAQEYLKALRQLDGGKDLKMKVVWPVAVNDMGEKDFNIVLIWPSFQAWGRSWDAFKSSSNIAQFEDLKGAADCPDSALWESIKIEVK
jgi:hypothetical protein